jgi:DNA invertase Pin-like site-specific DNA recombinase
MKQYFAYIRVSTTRQGESGVSLPQQRDAIERYAQRNQLEISRWFEEQETAAKQGRPVFGTMVKLLRKQDAAGVLIHKIDRSARNLRDWADLGELIDKGIEVHFANESLDMTSRGGRLSADIQAVVASDYIRNLREESKKGIYGRLKQGYYPMPAPLFRYPSGAAQDPRPQHRPADPAGVHSLRFGPLQPAHSE